MPLQWPTVYRGLVGQRRQRPDRSDGHTQHIRSRETSWALRPSGIALEPNGSFLIAQLGEIDGEPPPDELRLPGHAGQALDYSQQPPATPRDGIPPELR